jgi:PhnB protein
MSDETIGQAELRLGDSVIMLAEATEEYKPTSAGIDLYVEDCDATYKRALEAGATSISPPKEEFYGDRSAGIRDQFENYWLLVIQRHPRFDLHQRGLIWIFGYGSCDSQ